LSKENNKNLITLKTLGGMLESKIYENQIVETKIGPGKLGWADIPLKEKMDTRNLNFNFEDIQVEMKNGTAINVGNPHVVFFVDELEKFNIEKIGPKIENHNFFPEKCNVTIAKKVNENHIKLKVWERFASDWKLDLSALVREVKLEELEKLVSKLIQIDNLVKEN